MEKYYSQSIAHILKKLQTKRDGLSTVAVKLKQEKYGQNKLPHAVQQMTKLKIFLEQWKSPLILILLVAGIVSGVLGEYIDMMVIFITVSVNVIIGFVQEYKADQSLKKLSQIISYHVRVLRDGKEHVISSEDIVVGDIMFIDAGDKIQADGRILTYSDLEIDESVLTGESNTIKKNKNILQGDVSLGDRKNMVYKGSTVVNGRARIVVTAIGVDTEIGKIAMLVKDIKEEKTPLQIQLSKMGKMIGIIVLFISISIFLLGIFSKSKHHGLLEMFETSVAVAVAAIPEGLVISMTVILAVGMQHILKRKALVRKLVAAETLGSVNVICTDKTGTLTEGNMKVSHIVTSQTKLRIDKFDFTHIDSQDKYVDAVLALRIGVVANDGVLEEAEDEEKSWKYMGDSTDTAFISMGMKSGLEKYQLDKNFPRIAEIPFDSRNKYMATLHHHGDGSIIYVKGAADILYKKCSFYVENGKVKRMTQSMRAWFQKQEDILTGKGLRVLGLAYKQIDTKQHTLNIKDIDNMVFVGLVALSDPLRDDVVETIKKARQAGIRIVMITGDHMRTAQSIARELDIPAQDYNICNGQQIEKMSDEELKNIISNISVFARVDPKHKIRIVQAFQSRGDVVAMTGDGVNDAPALKGADIGVALGSGTDVAKEIADMVLLDNNFSSIVDAVEEGRGIYQNIKKVILYLLSGSFAEVVLIAGSLIAGLPLAVLPAQILWVNLIEDSFPNMALAFDKGDRENMKEKPRAKHEAIIDKEMKIMIVIISIVSNMVLLTLFFYFLKTTGDIDLARTLMFVGLGIDSLLYIYSVRSMRRHVWHMNPFDNIYLTLAVLFGWCMLVGAVYIPALQILLRTVSIGIEYWVVMIAFGLLNVALIEIVKGVFLVKRKV